MDPTFAGLSLAAGFILASIVRGILALAARAGNRSPRGKDLPVMLWFVWFLAYWAGILGLAVLAWALHPVVGIVAALLVVKYFERLMRWIVCSLRI